MNINAPDAAPPELPRALVKLEDTIVQIGLNRFQLVMTPPSHVACDYGAAAEFARSRSLPVLERLFESGQAYEWAGMIGVVEFPAAEQEGVTSLDAASPVAARMLSLPDDAPPLASFNLQVGFRHGDYYRNYTVSGYDKKRIEIRPNPATGAPTPQVAEFKSVEVGVQLTIDVNNKPIEEHGTFADEIAATMEEHARAFFSYDQELRLGGLLI